MPTSSPERPRRSLWALDSPSRPTPPSGSPTRAITLTEPLREQIAQALDTLGAKGANDALLLGTDAAFVVNVPNRTVVTALAPDEMHDRVVTQIDSALIL